MRSQLTAFVAVVAVTLLSGFLFISGWALIGQASTPGVFRVIVVLTVVSAAVWLGKPSGDWKRGAYVGIAFGLGVLIGAELIGENPSLGMGQVGALVGAVLAIPILERAWEGHTSWLLPALGITLGILVCIVLVRAVLEGGALGHDESAYALKSRSWVFGTPDTGWQLHRAPLITVLGMPVIAFTESEVAIRLVGVVTALFTLGTAALLGHRIGGRWTALLAAAGVGASLPFLRRGSEYLTDVPAAGILLLITWLAVGAVRDPAHSERSVILLGPLVAAAFYMRYQSALAIVGIAIATFVIWPHAVRQLRRSVLLAAGIATALVVPHLIWATIATGRPWGIVTVTSDAAGRAFLGEGLVDYARMFTLDLGGPLGAALMATAIVWMVWALVRRSHREDVSLSRFVLIVIAIAVIPLGIVAHGEPRFVFYPVWLMMTIGAMAAVRVIAAMRARWRAVTVVVAIFLWIPLFTETASVVDRNAEARGESFAVLVEASNEIEADAKSSCDVVTTYQPQVTWYSGCFTEYMARGGEHAGFDQLPGENGYVLLFENGKRQPADAEARYAGIGPAQLVVSKAGGLGDATIIKAGSS